MRSSKVSRLYTESTHLTHPTSLFQFLKSGAWPQADILAIANTKIVVRNFKIYRGRFFISGFFAAKAVVQSLRSKEQNIYQHANLLFNEFSTFLC